MAYLILGIVLFSFLHLVPAVPLGIREVIINKTDKVVYKGLFALLVIASGLLIVFGWKATPRTLAFSPPDWAYTLNVMLMLATAILFVTPYLENNLKRLLRHPQLVGVVLWGIGHTLATGQQRSLLLFGGLAAWAIIEIVLLNRRDTAWDKPPPAPRVTDLRLLIAGVGFFAIFMFTHVGLFGVSPVPGWR